MTTRKVPDPSPDLSEPENGHKRPSDGPKPPAGAPGPPEGLVAAHEGRTEPAPAPGRGQLLNLLDRAERGVLTAAEARLLRTAVGSLLTECELVSVLSAELARARVELLRVVREAGAFSPLLAGCPLCKALAGSRCRAARGVKPPEQPHRARREAAGRALLADALGGEQR